MHVITGQIRRAPFTKEGKNANGNWKMFAVDLSERHKDKDGQSQYTNYRAVFFAKESMLDWYNEAFQEGKVISVSGDSLAVNEREHNGKTYITLELQNPRLMFSQRGGESAPQQQQQRQQQRQQQPQQQSQFDDDIPF